MKKKGLAILLASLVGLSFLTACEGEKEESALPAPTAVEQVLNVSLDAEPDSLDIARVSDSYSFAVAAQVFEGLMSIEVKDGKEVPVAALAEKWESSEDGLTWTFHLRDAKWSDGEPVKAQDFEYGMKRILDPKTASPISWDLTFLLNAEQAINGEKTLDEVGVKAIDNKTLELKLAYPVPYLLTSVSGVATYPVRKDIVEKFGTSYGTEADKMVFCGPFAMSEWVHNSKIAFDKNENYWDHANVKLEQLNFKIIAEEMAMMGEFENGNLDMVGVGSAEWIDKLSQENKYEKQVLALPRTQYLFFNQEIKLFSNAKVRKAFSVALNREEIVKDVFKDVDKVAYGWIPSCMDLDGENFRGMAGEPIKALIDEVKDPKALLVEGMKELGLGDDPTQINIQLMVRNTAKGFGEYLQHHYKETLGVNITLDPVEWPVFQERNRGLDYEMGFKSYGADINDPASMLTLWMTGMKTVPTGWSNAKYDALIKEASTSLDQAIRKNNFIEAERLLIQEDAAIVPYAYQTSTMFLQKNVKGIEQSVFLASSYKNAYKE